MTDSTPVEKAVDSSTYTITFERIGRQHSVAPLSLTDLSADEIAEAVWRYARKHLLSSDFDVTVNLAELRGSIEFGRFGNFTIEKS